MWRVRVHVTLRQGILDPAGKATEAGIRALGFSGVEGVRIGKVIDFTLSAADEAGAREQVESLCRRLLANPVIEDYHYQLTAGTAS